MPAMHEVTKQKAADNVFKIITKKQVSTIGMTLYLLQ